MTRQKVTYTAKEKTSPEWTMDELDRHGLIAGGGFLKASDFAPNSEGKRYVAAGTLVGRTWLEADGGTGYGTAMDTDEQVYLTLYDVDDAAEDPHVSLYRHGCQVRVKSLPGWAAMAAPLKDLVRTNYEIV
jgi:hypothetical protein